MNVHRAQGWHRDFGHWQGDPEHASVKQTALLHDMAIWGCHRRLSSLVRGLYRFERGSSRAGRVQGSGFSEAAQRERWEVLNSPDYWPTPFDPDVPASGVCRRPLDPRPQLLLRPADPVLRFGSRAGGLFGHNTYIEHNHGAQWVRWEVRCLCLLLCVYLLPCAALKRAAEGSVQTT